MLELSDRAPKITEKHVKGSSRKDVKCACKTENFSRDAETTLLKNKDSKDKIYNIIDEE